MDQIFSQVVSTITGGITVDLLTVIGGLVILALIVFGYGLLQNVIDPPPSRDDYLAELDDKKYLASSYRGTARGDLYQRSYKRKLREFEARFGDDIGYDEHLD